MNTRKDKIVSRIAIAAAGCAFVTSIHAATFPNAGGDLASPSAWGGSLPGTSETIILNQAGTYTASGDVSFGQFQIATGGAVTLDMRGRTVAVNNKYVSTTTAAASTAGYGFAPRYNGNVDITLQGGFWNFANVNHFYAAESGKSDIGGSVLLTDGAIVTNVYTFMFGEHSIGNSVILDNAKVYAVALENWATGNHNLCEIRNGGEMHLSSHFYLDNAGNAGAKTGFNVIRVTGLGSWLNVTGGDQHSSTLGSSHQEDALIVTDHARLDIARALKLGCASTGAASNCTFTVENCATANVQTVVLGATNPCKGSRMNVLSGAVANISDLTVGVGGETCFNKIVVSNATLNVSKSISFPDAYSSRSNELWIVDGAQLTGSAWSGEWGQNISKSYGNRIYVRNADLETPYIRFGNGDSQFGGCQISVTEGARLINSEYCTIGAVKEDNQMLVSNATWTTMGAYIGGTSGVRNYLCCVGSNTSVRITASTGLVAGTGENARSNRIEVLNGAHVDMDNVAAAVVVGQEGSYNEGLVDSACVTCGYVCVGAKATAAHNRLTIRNSTFSAQRTLTDKNYTADPFGDGYDNTFTLDGTDWYVGDRYFRMSVTGSNNVMRLVNGSKITVENQTCSIGNKSANSRNNTWYVGAGCTLDLPRMRLMAIDSKLVISNGTLTATDTSNGICIGYRQSGENEFATGNALRIEGDQPYVSTQGPLRFGNNSRLEALLPKTAYAKGYVPLRGKEVVFDATSVISVEGPEFYEKTGGKVVLCEATNSVTLPEAVITASLAKMPAGCRLYVSGKQIIFRAPGKMGVVLIVQ